MSYKEFIIEELKKTGLKPNSIKLYSIKLNKLFNDLQITEINNDFLKDEDKIIKYINNLKSNDDKLAYLNSIIKVLSDNKELKERYINLRNNSNKIKFDKYKNNLKTSNFTEYEELLNISKNVNFNTMDVKSVLYDFLTYISVRYPMRLILSNIRITKTIKDIQPDINYIYVSNKDVKFILQDFKNIKSFGKTVIKLDIEDAKVVKEYLKYMKKYIDNQEFLLYNFHNKIIPFSSPDIYARVLKRTLKDKLQKDLTMNDIRKSYESNLINSDKYKTLTNNEKDILHKRLLHTTNIAHSIYNKV